ncbi:hypothetical protein DZB84_18475 [Bacillus sp. HNG]|uniref:hypothetical protein n=1 Tax=Bacillus sp. HNG TaxID=2293325 RepID=UPI000E2F2B6E|nr:hypothetical protein [Bacillus sp. HNG]RFB12736.1 hypothetical protein DZB84_18475 [Bacillus sp. HNG]
MREVEFKSFLINSVEIESKVKGVTSRVAKALYVERELKVNLDSVVKNDEEMYGLLLRIQNELNDKQYHNVHQNAVRKYYLFVNEKEFPRIKQYERTRANRREVI